jgi:hypothetical protein
MVVAWSRHQAESGTKQALQTMFTVVGEALRYLEKTANRMFFFVSNRSYDGKPQPINMMHPPHAQHTHATAVLANNCPPGGYR